MSDNEMVASEQSREKMIEDGKPFALLSHVGGILCLPLFVIPFVMEKNEFALVHAKYAATAFCLSILTQSIVWTLISISCGLLSPLAILPIFFWIPLIQGILAASNGTVDEPLVVGPIAKMVFGEDFAQLT